MVVGDEGLDACQEQAGTDGDGLAVEGVVLGGADLLGGGGEGELDPAGEVGGGLAVLAAQESVAVGVVEVVVGDRGVLGDGVEFAFRVPREVCAGLPAIARLVVLPAAS
ncbi:hypothetical protein NKG05_00995 [Oerskovia sp. M15]